MEGIDRHNARVYKDVMDDMDRIGTGTSIMVFRVNDRKIVDYVIIEDELQGRTNGDIADTGGQNR
jgi:hypothetical protein